MMIELDDFSPITLKDKQIFDKIYKEYPPLHSEQTFTSLIAWTDYIHPLYLEKDGSIIVASNMNCRLSVRPPAGQWNKELCDDIMDFGLREGGKKPFVMIDSKCKEKIELNYPDVKLKEDRDFFDYVYLSEDLAKLSGKGYASIRRQLNKFRREHHYEIELINEISLEEVKLFLKRWCLWKDCESDPFLKHERKAVVFCADNFFELGLSGIIIRVNGEIGAISIFKKMSDDTAVIYFEKGLPQYPGIYKAINAEAASFLKDDVKYINRQSDMGIEGLRIAKTRYRPHHMENAYYVER